MVKQKLSTIADIQCGLVLSRKKAQSSESLTNKYKRLNLRSLGEEGLLRLEEMEDYFSSDSLDSSVLTQCGDVLVRLFAPISPVLINATETGFVIPSQLAVIRIKAESSVLPEYVRWYLSQQDIMDKFLFADRTQLQRAITIGALASVLIPMLPTDKQRLIAKVCEIGLRRERLYQELILQEELYKNIQIQKAIGGTVE